MFLLKVSIFITQRGGMLTNFLWSDLWNTILSVQNTVVLYEVDSILLNLKKLAFFNDTLKKVLLEMQRDICWSEQQNTLNLIQS
jgi:hypothetical protein